MKGTAGKGFFMVFTSGKTKEDAHVFPQTWTLGFAGVTSKGIQVDQDPPSTRTSILGSRLEEQPIRPTEMRAGYKCGRAPGPGVPEARPIIRQTSIWAKRNEQKLQRSRLALHRESSGKWTGRRAAPRPAIGPLL